MTNLLDQAISCDDGNRAAKIVQNALGAVNSALASSASGCRPKRAIYADGKEQMPERRFPLPQLLPKAGVNGAGGWI